MKQPLDKRTTFIAMDGTEIKFVPFSWDEYQLARVGLMDEYRKRGDQIDCPKYTVNYAGGTSQTFDHDTTSILQVPQGTPEEDKQRILEEQQAAWAAWQDATARYNVEDQELLTEFIFTDSLGGISLNGDSTWETRQSKRHVPIPQDPEEKRRHYINTVLLKSKGDQLDLIAQVVAVSMGVVKEEDLAAIKASFRDQIWGNSIQLLLGRDAARKAENTAPEGVDGKPKVDRDPGAETVAINEGGMERPAL